ncbi:Membrane metallo-endopeptidase-like 1 [Araneus ventricosus]|uniref:Membrane metallo-endopeptidase-like 1 n=1 Tax=Araneus ventricosus TaxID=182803 RepID=A0A4Y2K1E7_ARAVE|nr:Membrane metallo-endopeptidase-like 1 [Araneus ventricosus]
MPLADYVPDTNESNLSTYYRNVLGVPVRKRVIIAVLAVFILLLIFVCALVYSKYGKHSGKNRKTSFAPYVPVADSLNSSVDPCTNFYNFTCGLWPDNELVSKHSGNRVSTFTILQDYVDDKKKAILENSKPSKRHPRIVNDAINFYKMCMSTNDTNPADDVEYLLNYFDKMMNGWPILNLKKWDGREFDWFKVSAFLSKTLHIDTVVTVGTTVDNNDSSHGMIYIKPPLYKEYQTLDSLFANNMMAVALTFIKHSSIDVSDASNVSNAITGIQETEKKWLEHFLHLPSFETNRTAMSIKELKEQIPNFDWLRFIQLVMNDTLNEIGEHVSDEDEVVVENLEVLKKSISGFRIDTFSNLELANLFGWFVVQKIWFFIPGLLWQYSLISQYSTEEFKEVEKSKCFDAVFDWYECGIDYLYVKNSSHSGVSDGEVIVHYIKNAFKELLENSDWMDESTKTAALDKLSSMRSIIGFPSYLQNKAEYSEVYKDFPKLTSSLIETYFKVLRYYKSATVKELKVRKSKNVYMSARSITHVSAYYDLQRNVFTLPLSIYNPPFYHYDGPWYLNFGAIGTIIGHEIMHGFDNLGCQRGPKGNLQNWWSNATHAEFRQRSRCFAVQYAAHRHLNSTFSKGVDTIDEDIADNEGLKIAYIAYKQWEEDNGPEQSTFRNYSSEQMFFLSFASVWCNKKRPDYVHHQYDKKHSFPYLRVNQVVSNSGYFPRVFNCSNHTPMNPERKCSMW